MVGRERRHGLMASMKTEERLVRFRISDLACWMGCRRWVRRVQPSALLGLVSSSIKARMDGTRRGKWDSRRLMSGAWTLLVTGNMVSFRWIYLILP